MEVVGLEGVEGIISEEQGYKYSWDNDVSKTQHGEWLLHSRSEVSGKQQLDRCVKIFGHRYLKRVTTLVNKHRTNSCVTAESMDLMSLDGGIHMRVLSLSIHRIVYNFTSCLGLCFWPLIKAVSFLVVGFVSNTHHNGSEEDPEDVIEEEPTEQNHACCYRPYGQVFDALNRKGQAKDVVGKPVLFEEVPQTERCADCRSNELSQGQLNLHRVLQRHESGFRIHNKL